MVLPQNLTQLFRVFLHIFLRFVKRDLVICHHIFTKSYENVPSLISCYRLNTD